MYTPPSSIVTLMTPFRHLFHTNTWRKAQLLAVGAILATGDRTVASVLRVLGLGDAPNFTLYHQVLNRARWSSFKVSRALLGLLVRHLASKDGPLVFAIDETLERRRGPRIAAAGIYRDPTRSSQGYVVKTNGLRWVSLMLIVPIPWANRHWALPFLTVLAPSRKYCEQKGKRYKTPTTFARQMLGCLSRWLPDKDIVVVGDGGYAAVQLLDACRNFRNPITMVARLRLDAALHAPAPERKPGQMGRPRLVGDKLPKLKDVADDPGTEWAALEVAWYDAETKVVEVSSDTALWYSPGKGRVPIRHALVRDPEGKFKTQALLCTDLDVAPGQMVEWFVRRWQVEVTFEEARAHLGVETQRQWSEKAIERTTPALFGLFSMVVLEAHLSCEGAGIAPRTSAWYAKAEPTFSDAVALVRRRLWQGYALSSESLSDADMIKVPRRLHRRMLDSLCYAA